MRLLKILVASIIFSLPLSTLVEAQEITLFDSEGTPVAYIETEEELTIFLWNGSPSAYLDGDSIYGFNGKHLGWFSEGVIRDHDGYGVGFIEGAVSKFTKFEPFKSFKKFKPFRNFQEFKPIKPLFSNRWSSMPLDLFLLRGTK